MSDLRPIGVPVTLEGVERHLLFTLNADDDIQEHFNMPLEEVINNLTDKREASKTVKYVLMSLLNDEAERAQTLENKELKIYSEKEIGWTVTQENVIEYTIALLKAYVLSIPEVDEDSSPN